MMDDMSQEKNTGRDEGHKSPTGPTAISADATSEHTGSANDNCSRMSDEGSNVNNGGFFIEKHCDVDNQDDNSENVLLENDDVESVSEHSPEPSLHCNDEFSERNCAGNEVPTLWDIATQFIYKHYERDIVKVKAVYAQVIAYYRAKYPHEEQGKKSEFSDIANELPAVLMSVDDNDDSKSDTSAEFVDNETDGEKCESAEVIVDDSLDKCKDGSEDVIIGTISKVHGKNDTSSSDTGSGSDSSASDSESESSGSQPDDDEIVKAVEMNNAKSESVRESESCGSQADDADIVEGVAINKEKSECVS